MARPDRIGALAEAAPNSDVDVDLKVLDREGNPVAASKFFHSGDHPTLRLRTREGFEVTGTHNHPVLCLEQIGGVPMLQWKLLDEVEPGTRVVISRHMEHDRGLPTQRELDAAFLAGAWSPRAGRLNRQRRLQQHRREVLRRGASTRSTRWSAVRGT